MNDSPLVMIVAGEPSGDAHGAKLCRQLKKQSPKIELFGMGGVGMASSGVELVHRIEHTGVVGFWEVFKDIGRYRKIFNRMVEIMDERRPDAVVLIDYPGFNIRFARQAHRRGIKVVYYISPQLWAWGRRRVEKIRKYVDRMVVIFAFEKEFYRSWDVETDFVGHPLVDILEPMIGEEEAIPALNLDGSPVIALLPGSRKAEIERILPLMLKTAEIVRARKPGVQFALPVASAELRPLIEEHLQESSLDIRLITSGLPALLRGSDLAIVASGTVTLEGAIFGVPMIIVYKLSFFSWLIARLLIRIDFIGLVNIVSGSMIVPEYIQFQARPSRIAARALDLLEDPSARAEMQSALEEVRKKMGPPGASRRAAEIILNLIDSQ